MSLEELVQQLIDDGKGDVGRLEHILSSLQRGVVLYSSDQEYIEKLLVESRKSESPEPEVESKLKETKVTETIHSEQSTQKEPTEIEQLRKEIHKLQDKNHIIEEHLRKQTTQKMRKGNAVFGVFLMAIGILMVVGGGAGAIDAMCFGQAYGTCNSDGMAAIVGIIIFWIGMIPTIFGVRLIAKA